MPEDLSGVHISETTEAINHIMKNKPIYNGITLWYFTYNMAADGIKTIANIRCRVTGANISPNAPNAISVTISQSYILLVLSIYKIIDVYLYLAQMPDSFPCISFPNWILRKTVCRKYTAIGRKTMPIIPKFVVDKDMTGKPKIAKIQNNIV